MSALSELKRLIEEADSPKDPEEKQNLSLSTPQQEAIKDVHRLFQRVIYSIHRADFVEAIADVNLVGEKLESHKKSYEQR